VIIAGKALHTALSRLLRAVIFTGMEPNNFLALESQNQIIFSKTLGFFGAAQPKH
jgi:hypothetical protein